MVADLVSQQCDLFAALLEYPTPELPHQAGACAALLAEGYPEAADLVLQFQGSVSGLTTTRMEEIYTRTFDLQPVCYPYVGYHLFGESYKRGAFMAQLNENYRSYGYSAGNELPDHVAVILRFCALGEAARNTGFTQALICEGLAPTLKKMAGALNAQPDNPYSSVVMALSLVFTDVAEKELIHV